MRLHALDMAVDGVGKPTWYLGYATTQTTLVSGVPATQDTLINSLNAAGWTLVVAYRDSTERIHNLTIFVGGSFVDEDSTEDYDFAGFCTPPSGPFDGHAVVSALEGDAAFLVQHDAFERRQ